VSDVSPSATAPPPSLGAADAHRDAQGRSDPSGLPSAELPSGPPSAELPSGLPSAELPSRLPSTAASEGAYESAEHAQARPTIAELTGADDGHDEDAQDSATASQTLVEAEENETALQLSIASAAQGGDEEALRRFIVQTEVTAQEEQERRDTLAAVEAEALAQALDVSEGDVNHDRVVCGTPATKRAHFAPQLVNETRDVLKDAEGASNGAPRMDDPTPGQRSDAAPTAGDITQAKAPTDHG
jgi:hypothetical protein